MSPRREPLLWLQCLALGAIPLELLLIRLLLAGADPGPVPGIERLLLWGVGVVAPAVALWKRPADWGSLLLVRRPTNGRGAEQQQLSSAQSNRLSGLGAVTAAVVLLPLLWWLDDSAVLVGEFSPVSSQSRLVTLLLSTPLLAVIVWQVQQLVQACTWLITDQIQSDGDGSRFSASELTQKRSSFGLQVLELQPLSWPDPVSRSSTSQPDDPSVSTAVTAEPDQAGEENKGTDLDAEIAEADPSVATAVSIEPDQAAEESEGASLDTQVTELDAVPSGETERHGEEPQPSGGSESEPENPPEAPPGGA